MHNLDPTQKSFQKENHFLNIYVKIEFGIFNEKRFTQLKLKRVGKVQREVKNQGINLGPFYTSFPTSHHSRGNFHPITVSVMYTVSTFLFQQWEK